MPAVALDHPIKHFGTQYDGASADGWHVTLRDHTGELESLAGPYREWAEAHSAYAALMRGERP